MNINNEEHNDNVIALKPLMSESHKNESLIKNNIEVHIKPKKTQSDSSLNLHTKSDTVIQRRKKNVLSTTGYCIPNKINSSMILLKELAFEPQSKDLPSLNKTSPCQIITMDYPARLYEEMIDIWIEKDNEIVFQIKGIWGIDEMGLCTCEGYTQKIINSFPLCSLLGRIGSQNTYIQIKNNMKYTSSISGPLFLLMNIDADTLLNNKYILSGSINIEIQNSKKYTYMQILKMLTFDEELLALLINDSCSKYPYSSSELSLLIMLNQVRTRPDLCLNYYFPTNFQITNIIRAKSKKCRIIKPDDILKKIAEEAKDEPSIENRMNKYNINRTDTIVKEYQIKTNSKHSSLVVYETMKAEDSFIFNDDYEYIGLSLKPINQNEKGLLNYFCVIVVSGKING